MSAHGEYAAEMQGRRELSVAVAVAVVGGVLGAAFVWLSRPDPLRCTTLDNGMRACMLLHVVGPPLWLYGAFAVMGALLAGGMTLGYAFVRRARGRFQDVLSGREQDAWRGPGPTDNGEA